MLSRQQLQHCWRRHPVARLHKPGSRTPPRASLQQQDSTEPPPPAAAAVAAGTHGSSNIFSTALNKVLSGIGIQLSDRVAALVLLNFTVLLYSSNWVVVKDSGSNFDPFAFAFLRFLVAALALSPFLKAAAGDGKVVRAGAEIGIWCAGGYLLQSIGLLLTDASRASFLATFTVIVVPILAGLSGRGVQRLTWGSALGAFAGMALLEGSGTPPSLGDVFSFLSACSFGVQVFRTEHWSRTLGASRALPLMSVVFSVTCACSLVAALAAHPAEALQLATDPGLGLQAAADGVVPWQAALYTGLLTTTLCLLIEVYALRDVASSEAAIIYSLEPVLGATWAYILLGERWGPLGWVGAALIIASSLATQLFGSEEGEDMLQTVDSQK